MATTKKKRSTMPVSKATNAFELLGEIREIILEEPLRYDQGLWLVTPDRVEEVCRKAPACGTVGCVAGWTVALKVGVQEARARCIRYAAGEILGLDIWQKDELFDPFAVSGVGQGVSHAKSGAAHIARFMKVHEAQLKAKAV